MYNARFAAKVIKRIHGYNVGIETGLCRTRAATAVDQKERQNDEK